jgi:hypothetical protein
LDGRDHPGASVIGARSGVVLECTPGSDDIGTAVHRNARDSRGVAGLGVIIGGVARRYARNRVDRVTGGSCKKLVGSRSSVVPAGEHGSKRHAAKADS